MSLAAGKSGRLREFLGSWGSSPGMPPIQTFQEHMVLYLCALHQDYFVFDVLPQLTYSGWSQGRRRRVKSLDVDGTLVQSCDAMGVGARKATIEHTLIGMRVLATEQGIVWEANGDRII